MVNPILGDPLVLGCACASVHPGLRSVLVFDITPTALESVATWVTQMLLAAMGETEVLRITLGSTESDDELWGHQTLHGNGAGLEVTWQPGLLLREQAGPRTQLVVIPDLSRLSMAVARACVMLSGGDIAHLERHGQRRIDRPNIFWLASCKRDVVGTITPHLLDRFALRLEGRVASSGDRREALISRLNEHVSQTEYQDSFPFLENYIKRLSHSHATKSWPDVPPAMVNRVLTYITDPECSHPPNAGSRRGIALARLAVAVAMLEGTSKVEPYQVDIAAAIIGLEKSGIKSDSRHLVHPERSSEEHLEASNSNLTEHLAQPERDIEITAVESTICEPPFAQDFPSTPFILDAPYPEDNAPVQREAASLRLPPRRFRAITATRGTVIGVQRAQDLRDIAWIPTLLEGAKFQWVRRQNNSALPKDRLPLIAVDLRTYRRSLVPEQMLVLVLDYTCLRNWDWRSMLLPHLRWAYVKRASVCLIRVGAADTRQELQADRVQARSLLVPCIDMALNEGASRATPLAHGLDLAFQTLRHSLQHGRSRLDRARLVVLTDGRGNVSLEASRNSYITPPTGRQGIKDALAVAHQLGLLNRIQAILIDPRPQQYPYLPRELAMVLGAKVIVIPSPELDDMDQ